MWYKFASLAGEAQTLLEMSNGFGTEHVYVRRLASTRDLVFGVEHSGGGANSAEHRTHNNSGIASEGSWHHLCWSIRHVLSPHHGQNATLSAANASAYLLPESLFEWSSLPRSFGSASNLIAVQAMALGYRALWDVYINGGQTAISAYEGLDGVMPIEGVYSVNYIGYGTLSPKSFFSGSIIDVRIYERPLDRSSMRAIFLGDACCTTISSGAYIDSSKRCTAESTFNGEFCRSCKSDCGPLNFIENEDNACTGRLDRDNTICARCKPCAQGQYINSTCSGTSFRDEGACIPCRQVRVISVCVYENHISTYSMQMRFCS
jgi:hypothetical protein